MDPLSSTRRPALSALEADDGAASDTKHGLPRATHVRVVTPQFLHSSLAALVVSYLDESLDVNVEVVDFLTGGDRLLPSDAHPLVHEDPSKLLLLSPDNPASLALCLEKVRQNGLNLKWVPQPLRRNLEICRAAVGQTSMAIRYVDPQVPGYRGLCLRAVRTQGYLLQHVSLPTRTDDEVCSDAVRNNLRALQWVSPQTDFYRDLCLLAIEQDGISLKYAESIQSDEGLCGRAVQQNPRAIQFVNESAPFLGDLFRQTAEDHPGLIASLPIEFLARPSIYPVVLQQNIRHMRLFGPDAPHYRAICLHAVGIDGLALRDMPAALRDDKEVVLRAIKTDPAAFALVSQNLQHDSEVRNAAGKRDSFKSFLRRLG